MLCSVRVVFPIIFMSPFVHRFKALTGADPGILKTGSAKISLALNPAPTMVGGGGGVGVGVKKMVWGGSVLRKKRGGAPLDSH